MYNLMSILLHLNIHKCDFAFITSFPYSLVLDSYIYLCSYLIHWFICMKIVAKRKAIFSLSYKEHVKVFNPFPSKKLNEYVIWKEKKRIPNVIV